MVNVVTKHGVEPLDENQINLAIQDACEGLEYIDWSEVATRCALSWYDGMTTDEISEATIMAACELIEVHPNYDFVAARLLLRRIKKEVVREFKYYIDSESATGGRLHYNMREQFEVDRLVMSLKYSRDKQFRYQGVKILYDRYLLRDDNGRLLETPQYFFMRVAMGIALGESENHTEWAIKFYDLISSFDYMPSTPTLFNAGTVRPQMASCYVTHVEDSLEGIFDAYSEIAQMSKWAGGIGTNWTSVRASGSPIKGTNGQSTGLVPWLKIQNDVAIAVNQGGKRRGSHCAYIEPWHADIEEFLELRKAVGDERRRTHDLDTALWIPDLFMKRVEADEDWSLFCPSQHDWLTSQWGTEWEVTYENLEKSQARKVVKARDLWKKILSALYETGHPWICFKDTCNRANPLQRLGMIRSSNLCTEITLNTGPDETAVCNLGSINLERHVVKGHGLQLQKLEKTVSLAVRMLDNIIDGMFYPTEKAAKTNKANRPVGLGLMGWQNALMKLGYDFDSEWAKTLCSAWQESIQAQAISTSERLAQERGHYANWPESVQCIPRRNSYVTAIAPTATISNIVGTSPSIEPLFSNLYTQSNLSGDFTIVNRFLIDDLINLGLWDSDMRDEIKYHNGSVQQIERIPENIRAKYKTAFEIDQNVLVDQMAARQKYICQSGSLNLYVNKPDGKALSDLYFRAWKSGVKTTYYLRTQAASGIEKSTIDPNKFGKTHINICNINDEGCESCT